MEIKNRIALLDNLLALNERVGLPEDQVITLVKFLADFPETERETILEYISQDDRDNRFQRFVKLANMEPGQRDKTLKAMGLQTASPKGFLQELFGSTMENTVHVKQAINDLADMRKTAQEGFLEPLARLFGREKQGKK